MNWESGRGELIPTNIVLRRYSSITFDHRLLDSGDEQSQEHQKAWQLHPEIAG